ncbi:flavin-dependent dehydrogenase [Candidatus Methanoperedens nitroreducens]|uniref:Flavin-dependent dehydrogenase n=1 Tax=Candidatus Methanoperedens nitratireducens TaxID=1392998 RepID=A0A062VA24_9EURY|nr:NAD(P)/FAD-dependent oxidoreductase [Candidatus Methanoperedens nitroreducens]KCZ73363.1 flavin-dependent dehydrogenase [Candidatus Methanoperedens nitroreducens]MDJ1422688.1 NAD(P)/FAD-dependent oxidoreductase [Candidatus Methanoperedens sp.]
MKYDVAVIGAGPAGSFAAEKLSSSGYSTLIIDPCDKKKACAGILTARYVRRYGIDEIFVERMLKGVRISFRDTRAEITYRNAVEYSINRESYDSFNLNQAIDAGSELKKDLVISIDEEDSFVGIKTKKEYIPADYAIIAAGVSDLSRICGGTKEYAFCVQHRKDQKPQDYFEIDMLNSGYSWTVPKKDHVITGTSSPAGYPDMPGERGLIPINGPVKNTFSRRFLLAGDAAGFVSPFEGEGIYYARRSGEIAAEVLSGTIEGRNTLSDYESRWKKEFDFSTLAMISRILSNERIIDSFVRSIRDKERFNKLVEDILTKENKELNIKDIHFLIKTLI